MSSAETASQNTSPPSSTGLLPAPPDAATKNLEVGSGQKVLLDELGPMVVNSNGTLSRIASKSTDSSDLRDTTTSSTHWSTMTEAEQKRTLRVLGSRNQLRLAAKSDADATHILEA
ncbi:uncharacterized protein C8R40DRAFT_1173393 [Lentinula edodes]|uniref:uncharacterized protein n=1 Tax=Lentinula edodes TaxID=5353 RepID=UPI001E8E30A2|nr:uncharacterized protein C8R40DRAFT_1173393 [Lentinula edodes]KAH7872642.1 hypothetical protein C8R40DRAFT_1173393 [Lentinula edodes]KAJ3917404.1 hypothetical protein F5877DRAFT_79992 [Lentinula edodes]